jgi:hypothetical protein
MRKDILLLSIAILIAAAFSSIGAEIFSALSVMMSIILAIIGALFLGLFLLLMALSGAGIFGVVLVGLLGVIIMSIALPFLSPLLIGIICVALIYRFFANNSRSRSTDRIF